MFTTHIHPVPPHGSRDGARATDTRLRSRVLARLSRRPVERPRLRVVSADDTSAAVQVVHLD